MKMKIVKDVRPTATHGTHGRGQRMYMDMECVEEDKEREKAGLHLLRAYIIRSLLAYSESLLLALRHMSPMLA